METEKTSIPAWTPEQNATIDGLQQKLGMSRLKAIHKLREGEKAGKTPEQILAEATAVKAKPAAKAKKAKAEPKAKAAKKSAEPKEPKFDTKPVNKGDAYFVESNDRGKFDKQLMVNLYVDGGLSLREVAAKVKCSPVYAHRVIIGVEKEAGGQGIDKGHNARRKEAAARASAAKADKK
jgi:hypothetical protein